MNIKQKIKQCIIIYFFAHKQELCAFDLAFYVDINVNVDKVCKSQCRL